MISISFKYDQNNDPVAVKCLGHAGFARYGKDIVCAAISALVINAVNSVGELTSTKFELESDEKTGYIFFELINPDHDAILILKSLKLGVESVVSENNSKFVKLVEWRV